MAKHEKDDITGGYAIGFLVAFGVFFLIAATTVHAPAAPPPIVPPPTIPPPLPPPPVCQHPDPELEHGNDPPCHDGP